MKEIAICKRQFLRKTMVWLQPIFVVLAAIVTTAGCQRSQRILERNFEAETALSLRTWGYYVTEISNCGISIDRFKSLDRLQLYLGDLENMSSAEMTMMRRDAWDMPFY